MKQPRRTFLQVLLGLFGLGAEKAVATTELMVPVTETWSTFDAAIGVVRTGSTTNIAWIEVRTGFRNSFSTPSDQAVSLLIREEHMGNGGMMFAESNSPDGALLVAELMKRCPERVFFRNRSREFSGLRTDMLFDDDKVLELLEFHDWNTADADHAMARALAIYGRRVLMATPNKFGHGDTEEIFYCLTE